MFGSFMNYLEKKRNELIAGLAVAGAVAVVYVVVSLIVWNAVSTSYAITYAVVAFLLFYIIQRLLRYLMTEKEGVIEKRK
jgi:cobalamin biosynthesis protein CobD/CbiB